MFGVAGSGDTSGFGGLVREPWMPPAADRPYGSYFDELVDNLVTAASRCDQASKVVVDRGELTLHVEREHLVAVATRAAQRPVAALRTALERVRRRLPRLGPSGCTPSTTSRSMTYRRRVRLEVAVGIDDPHIPSLTTLYPGADWQERETYDMFGIVFDGHPALTRILMPDDWDGHPQRKDYPLGGIPVQYKGATIPPPDERRAYK